MYALDTMTVYAEGKAFGRLQENIRKYIKKYHNSRRSAAIKLGIYGGHNLSRWETGDAPVPLKHLIPIFKETEDDLISFLSSDGVIVKGTQSHKYIKKDDVYSVVSRYLKFNL
jgi:hypothetical protein